MTAGRWSLRARLLAGQIALLTAVCLGIGAATEVALHRYLVHELDSQLLQITQRSSMMERRPPPRPAGVQRSPTAERGHRRG